MEPLTLLLFCVAALVVAALVVVSGFGLGTALTPLFLLAYDVKTAVFLVAVVHFANNLFRLTLFRRQLDLGLLRRFGLTSVAGALTGSLLQNYASNPGLEIGLGGLLVVLGGFELLSPRGSAGGTNGMRRRIPRRFDQLGGLLSGLLGGLVGNQGALRSGYLLNYALPKESFIATGTAVACLIDASRIPVYFVNYHTVLVASWPYLLAVILAAFAGTLLGKRLVVRLSLRWFRWLVAALIAFTGAFFILTNV